MGEMVTGKRQDTREWKRSAFCLTGKGQVESIGWTLVILVAVVFITFVVILYSLLLQFNANNPASSPEFVAANSKASSVAYVLAYLMVEDRPFLEQAVHIAETSVDDSHSENLNGFLSDFFDKYRKNSARKIRIVSVSIYNWTGGEVFQYSSEPGKCGDELQGYCVDSRVYVDRAPVDYGCGKGRKEIGSDDYDNSARRCRTGICCIEDEPYQNVEQCGPELKGVCDFRTSSFNCFDGRIKISDESCSSGFICCLPATQENLVETGLAYSAEVPFFFNTSVGKVVVTAG